MQWHSLPSKQCLGTCVRELVPARVGDVCPALSCKPSRLETDQSMTRSRAQIKSPTVMQTVAIARLDLITV